jgi:hypothetical protein
MNPTSDTDGHLVRDDATTDTNSKAPGGVTDTTPGYTDRVQRILVAARAKSNYAVTI